MKRRTFVKGAAAALPALAALGFPDFGAAGELEPITLPKPEMDGGKSVLAALKDRKTVRNISPDPLPLQTLSNLLWAAFGVNRPEAGLMGKPGRTAPSASNSQEIELYVCLAQGVYLYEAVSHRLAPVAAGDFRARAGRSAAVKAPVNIFYVVDLARYVVGEGQPDRSIGNPEVQKSYYYTDTGFIAQNVYLSAASQGLAAWFHNCDKENTAREFKLRPEQRVLFAQTVGYPMKA
ncbi:MAG: SagB/ThcOx family dehydrogenase [Candidatus Aminicenantes bacterium]|nr:SagB/ThcOx family dehydrogenase [Candidatus Aminicenantes bacterium]